MQHIVGIWYRMQNIKYYDDRGQNAKYKMLYVDRGHDIKHTKNMETWEDMHGRMHVLRFNIYFTALIICGSSMSKLLQGELFRR